MLTREQRKHDMDEDGLNSGPIPNLIPAGIEAIKEIGLSPLEKRAIFLTLKKKIDEFKKSLSIE